MINGRFIAGTFFFLGSECDIQLQGGVYLIFFNVPTQCELTCDRD